MRIAFENKFDSGITEKEILIDQIRSVSMTLMYDKNFDHNIRTMPVLIFTLGGYKAEHSLTLAWDNPNESRAYASYGSVEYSGSVLLSIEHTHELLSAAEDYTNQSIEELSGGTITYGQVFKKS